MTGFILAAGLSTRFNGHPKQLLICDGETLLDRQARQFSPFCKPLYIVTHQTQLFNPKAVRLIPENRRIKATTLLSTAHRWFDTVVVMHGDVYFTEEAKELIVNNDCNRTVFFGRGNETYAMRIPPEEHMAVIRATGLLIENSQGTGENEAGLSHLREVLDAAGAMPELITISDATQDFDTPQAYAGWQRGERHHP